MSNHNVHDPQERTPLHAAAVHGDLPELRRLLMSGADPSAADIDGFTPLHFAIQQSHVEAVSALLAAGADVNRRNRFGNGPLFTAVFNSRGHGEIIRLLRARGADPYATNAQGQTPVGLARLIANYDVAQFFADIDSE
jgi:uncharacterized protein